MQPGDKVNTWQIVVNNNSNNNLASVPLIPTANSVASVPLIIPTGNLAESETSSTNRKYSLHDAINDNKLNCFKKSLAACENIDELDTDGNTPLHLAVRLGNLIMVKSLLKKGANVGLVDRAGNTVLHYAVKSGNLEVVKLLLAHVDKAVDAEGNMISGEQILNQPNLKGNTVLHYAVKSGNLAIVKLLLAHVDKAVDAEGNMISGEQILNQPNLKGNTVLHYAVKSGNLAIVKLLLDHGAAISINKWKWTPLNCAVESGNLEVVKLLLEHIVKAEEIKDENGKLVSPEDIINLRDCENRHTALHYAAASGNLAIVKLLLDHGAAISINKWQKTPLHYAAERGNLEVVKLLLAHIDKAVDAEGNMISGKQILNQPDLKGNTILHYVAGGGNIEMVQLLLGHGAAISINKWKWTPLHCAAASGNLEVVKLLLAHIVKAEEIKDENGNIISPEDIINLRDRENGDTALHCAVRKDNLAIVKLLLDHGAAISINKWKWTPLNCAVESGNLEVVKLLLEHIVKAEEIKDENGNIISPEDIINLRDRKNGYGYTALHYAAASGNLAIVKLLLDHGAAIGINKWKWTPLHCAAESGNLEMVQLLLDRVAAISINKWKWTPLHSAAESGNLEVVKLLLEHIKLGGMTDAEGKLVSPEDIINLRDCENRYTALHYAVKSGNLAIVKLLLDHGAAISINKWQKTPLHYAAESGNLEVVKLLLEHIKLGGMTDAEGKLVSLEYIINLRDYENGYTALHYAVKKGNLEMVKLLLDRGAAISINEWKWTPLNCAAASGNLEMVKLLLDRVVAISINKWKWTPLHSAAASGKPEVVKLLLEHIKLGGMTDAEGKLVSLEYIINLRDCESGDTALHCAVKKGNLAIVKLLLDRGAAISINKWTWTPLHCAVESGNLEVVKLLLEHIVKAEEIKDENGKLVSPGDIINFRDRENGYTALHCAVKKDNFEMVKLLLDHGAAISINKWQKTPLHYAAESGNLEVVKLLLEHIKLGGMTDAEGKLVSPEYIINLRDCENGDTALHYAVKKGNLEMVKLLLDRGAAISINEWKWTPLNCAVESGNLEVVKLLLAHIKLGGMTDAEGKLVSPEYIINLRDCEKRYTALHYAVKKGNFEMVKLLLDNGADLDYYYGDDESEDDESEDDDDFVGDDKSVIELAVYNGNIKIIELLLNDKGIDHQDGCKQTALHHAISARRHVVVEWLVKRGADVNLLNQHTDNTPLGEVVNAYCDHKGCEIAELLLNSGASLNIKNSYGWTVLHYAVSRENCEITKWLLKYIAKTEEIKDENGNVISPEDIINHQANSGNTPLHCAGKSAEIFTLLLDMGANPNIPNNEGLSVRDIISNPKLCRQSYHFDARKVLEEWDQKYFSEIKVPIDECPTAANNGIEADQVENDNELAGVEPMDISSSE